jgi:phage shock protein E
MTPIRLLTLLLVLFAPALAAADPLWIDVRSPEEYQADHIVGDPNVTYDGIALKIESLAPSKDTEIVLYCRSGRRADVARMTLEGMGYTRVRNAGGIADARKERGCDTAELAANCAARSTP